MRVGAREAEDLRVHQLVHAVQLGAVLADLDMNNCFITYQCGYKLNCTFFLSLATMSAGPVPTLTMPRMPQMLRLDNTLSGTIPGLQSHRERAWVTLKKNTESRSGERHAIDLFVF